MMRKLTAGLLALCLIISCLPVTAASDRYDDVNYWDGTVDTTWYNGLFDTYTLYTGAQLAGMASLILSGRCTFAGKTIKLGADIVLNSDVLDRYGDPKRTDFYEWTPIGGYQNGWQPFSGTFDGQGHIISGLYDNSTYEYNSDKNHGLFGYAYEAEIRNVAVIDSYIYAYDYAGGLVGNAYGTRIVNCCFSGSVSGPLRVGGVAGALCMGSEAINCFACGAVRAYRYVGGLAGYIDATSTLENSCAAANVFLLTGAAEKYGDNTFNGSVAGVADEGAEITGCYYRKYTAAAPIGRGLGEAGAVAAGDQGRGYFVDVLNRWVENDETGLYLSWTGLEGYPCPASGSNGLTFGYAVIRDHPEAHQYIDHFAMDEEAYAPGQFLDVDEAEWYGYFGDRSIMTAVCLGLMNGYTDGAFKPDASLKVCEAVKMAVSVYDIYSSGQVTDFYMGPVWYEEVVAYAIEKGIILEGDFTDYEAPATRAQMAYIFSRALPDGALEAMNTIDSLPDVDQSTPYCESIFRLYRAGVLSGNDEYGRFDPGTGITRAQAAAIIARMAVTDMRKTLGF